MSISNYPFPPDVNECDEGLSQCDNFATCRNNEGSYECICNPGFEQGQTSKACEGKSFTMILCTLKWYQLVGVLTSINYEHILMFNSLTDLPHHPDTRHHYSHAGLSPTSFEYEFIIKGEHQRGFLRNPNPTHLPLPMMSQTPPLVPLCHLPKAHMHSAGSHSGWVNVV